MCNINTFSLIYELEKRRLNRNKITKFLVHIVMLDKKNIISSPSTQEKIKDILKRRLRSGDVVCEWDINNYLILLMNINQKNVKKVVNRIENLFKNSIPESKQLHLYYDYYKIQQN